MRILISLCITFALINSFIIKRYFRIPFFNNYFNDLIFPILIMAVFFVLKNKLNRNAIFFSKKEIFVYFIGTSIWFEYISPLFQKAYTSDSYDIYFYAIGFCIYGFVQHNIQVNYEKDDDYLLW